MLPTALLPALLLTWTGLLTFSPGNAAKVSPPCDQNLFNLEAGDCWRDFNSSMEDSGYQDRCPWPDAKWRYNSLTLCVENGAKTSLCMGHMFLIDEVLLQIHQTYFSLCRQVQDPPLLTAFMLMAPGVVFTLFMPFLCVHLTTRLTAAM